MSSVTQRYMHVRRLFLAFLLTVTAISIFTVAVKAMPLSGANAGATVPTLTIANVEDEESFGILAFSLTLNQPAATTVTGKISTINITATAPADFTALTNQPFTITAGSSETVVYVNIVDDSFYELTETFKVSVTQLSNATTSPAEEQGWAHGSILDDDTIPAVRILDQTVSESAGTANLSLMLSAPNDSNTSVTIQTFEDSANTGVDFVATTKTVVIPIGQMSATVPITIENDTLDEIDEQFVVLITNASIFIEDDESRVTITDDDAQPNLTVLPISASETDTVVIFQVMIDTPSGRNVTGRANTSNGTAIAGADYVAQVNKLFTIPSGITTTTIYVPVNNESLYERDETFNLAVSNVANAVVLTSTNVGTILNDDQAPVLSIGDAVSAESDELQFLVTLNADSAVDVTGSFTTTDRTALAGSDYVTSANVPFTIAAGSISTTLPVALIDDLLFEKDEALTVTLGSLVDGIAGNISATGLITDDDPIPYLSVGDAVANEGAGTMTFTISINRASSLDVTGLANTLNGDAKSGNDYSALSLQPFTITAGITSTQVAVTILEDLLDENNEIFKLSAVNLENAEVLKEEGNGTIIDNDTEPTLSITSTSFLESSSGLITVTLDTPSGRVISGTLTTSNGSAIGILDYGPLSQKEFTIAVGETQTAVEFYIINDTTDEDNEDFQASLSTVNNAIAGNSTINITLIDDDAPPTISVIAASVSEAAGSLNVPVRLSQPSGKLITGTLSTSDDSAKSPADFTSLTQVPFTITAGASETLLAVAITDDSVDENNEVFSATLNSVSNATLNVASANQTILDDDLPPVLTIADRSGDEAIGTLTFTVSIDAISSLAVTGKATTANSSAVGGKDFTALTSVPFTIPAGSTSTLISVTINNDVNDEYDEVFSVNLTSVARALVGDASATATIIDNDLPPTVSISSASALEASGSLNFNVAISVPSGKEIKLQVSTFDDTAQSPGDYVKQSDRSFIIAAGKSSETIVVEVVNDPSDEPDETLTLYTSLIDPSTASLTTSTLTGTILDDDLPPTLTVADVSTSEANGQVLFTLTLSAPSAFGVNGTVNTSNGSATAGTDYTAQSNVAFSFAAGSSQATIVVPLFNDFLMENSETFTLTVVDLNGASKLDAVATATILDDDSTGTGNLIIKVDVTPKSIQNFKFTPAFAPEFYLDDEVNGAQNDQYSNQKSFSLNAGQYTITPVTPYSYFLMDVVCTSNGIVIKSGVSTQLPVLGSGQTVLCTFVNERGIIVRAHGYNDLSENRQYDQADANLAGVQTKLFVTSETVPLLTETTGASGTIDWGYRKPGPYTICAAKWPLTTPLMVQPTLLDPTYALPCYRFNMNPGAIADVYFGFRVDDGTVVAAVEGVNEFNPALTAGSIEEGVLFSQAPMIEEDMQGYEDSDSQNQSDSTDQPIKVFLPVVSR